MKKKNYKELEFTHLHLHSEFSVLDSIIKIKSLVEKAKRMGLKSLAITDHGNVDGSLWFYEACKEAEIKPIVGCEFYLAKDLLVKNKDEKRLHVTVLAKNWFGFQKIMKALNIANRDGFYYRPRIDANTLFEVCDSDVIVMSACTSGLLSGAWGVPYLELVNQFKEKYEEDFYLEIMPLDFELQKKINGRAMKLYKKGFKIVCTNDCHYLDEQDYVTHEVSLAIMQKKRWEDKDRWKFDVNGLYLKSRSEMIKSLRGVGIKDGYIHKCLVSIDEIIKKCEIKMTKFKPTLPSPYKGLSKKEEIKLLREKAYAGAATRGLDIGSKVKERLDKELNTIVTGEKGTFVRYFLIIEDLIIWARKNMLVGPGRGSVGGSLVAYCLGITDVNPLRWGLIFERFLSEGRIDLPDIDLDFPSDKRFLVRKYLEDKYGSNSVVGVSNYNRFKGKGALRAVSRVFNVSLKEVDEVSKVIQTRSTGDMRSEYSLYDSLRMFEVGKEFERKYPIVVKHAIKLEGVIRNYGIHAAGIVVSSTDLSKGDQCVVARRTSGGKGVVWCTNWDKRKLEFFGLCKIDALGLSALSIISETIEKVGLDSGWVDKTIQGELDNKEVFEMINKGQTIGVFQLNTYGMRDFVTKLGVSTFLDMVDANALFRPGTLRTGLSNDFVERKNGRRKVVYFNNIYKDITKSTQGIMVYQEQIMYILNRIAGIGWRTVDVVRKAISKSQGALVIAKFREQFVSGCLKMKTLSKEEASEMFDKIEVFGSYSFNKSHSLAYSVIAYLTALLKVKYPVEFLCACLNNKLGEDAKVEFVDEIKRLGIKVEYPDINYSEKGWNVKNGSLIMGLQEIAHVGDKSIQEILNARNSELFIDKEDFLNRVKKRIVNKRIVGNLEKCNALFNKSENSIEVVESVFKFKLNFDESKEFKHYLSRLPLSQRKMIKTISELENIKGNNNTRNKRTKIAEEYVFGRVRSFRTSHGDYDKKRGKWNYVPYFHFEDDKAFALISFTNEFYEKNKTYCENIEGKYLIVKVKRYYNKEKRRYNQTTSEVWDLDSIFRLDKKPRTGFPFSTIRKVLSKKVNVLSELQRRCKGCKEDCAFSTGKPVPFELGNRNILIVAEAPGRNEHESGKPLVGKAGNLFWNKMKEFGLGNRSRFCITNVLKCRPPNNKINIKDREHQKGIKTCSEAWLDKEIALLKPSIIFALGSTAIGFLEGKRKDKVRVMQKCGTIKWDLVRGCFIVYSIHPLACLYSSDNISYLDDSIKVLKRMIKEV